MNAPAPALYGEYPLRADAKGRFLLPAALLQLLDPSPSRFVWARGLDPCLVLYPEPVWTAELQRLYARNRFDPQARSFARLFQSGAQPVSLDAQHRLLIPKPLWDELMATTPQSSQVTTDLTLVGAFDRIEVWAEARYRLWLSEQLPLLPTLADAFTSLT